MTMEEEIILEITKLTRELVNLPANGGDTEEEARIIYFRKAAIESKVQSLKEELLYEQEGHDIIIKVNFTWGWLRVYRNKRNELEWY